MENFYEIFPGVIFGMLLASGFVAIFLPLLLAHYKRVEKAEEGIFPSEQEINQSLFKEIDRDLYK